MSERTTLDDGTIIDKAVAENGYASTWIAGKENQSPFVHLYVDDCARIYIDRWTTLAPEVLAAIGETFAQWADRAKERGEAL